MSYYDILLPFVIGCAAVASPQTFVKVTSPNYEKKRKRLRGTGFVLMGVGVVFAVVEIFR